MSAIFGIYYLDGRPVQPQLLEHMSDILKHRGSDSTGIWHDGAVGFGHRMLWTTPESLTEQLPRSIQNGDLTITADARIDNRDELLADLGVSQYSEDPPISDSEIILLAYEKWGEDCPAKLLGDFAFAIFDRHEQKVFCARDRFGVKAFHYYCSEKVFVFATEIKGLFCSFDVPRRLNELGVGNYLTAFYDDLSSTLYEEILRLPSSTNLSVSHGTKRLSKYWSLDPARELRLSSDGEYAEAFRELFTEAVRCRMRSAYPIGSMLSGGLDSSSIACTARKLMTDNISADRPKHPKLHTFSAIFEQVSASDESPFINAVLEQGNFEPHYLKADRVSPLTDLEKIIWHQDGAVQLGNLYINWHLYNTAKDSGVRVILDGFDGDTTVSHGKMYLSELAHAKRWWTLYREAKGYASKLDEDAPALIWAYYWRFGIEPRLAGRRFMKPVRSLGARLYKRALTRDKYQPTRVSQFDFDLNAEFLQRIDLKAHHHAITGSAPRVPKTEREGHYQQFSKGIRTSLLEILDRTAAPFDVEVRYPFWDHRLAEFCLSLPAKQKMHSGFTRMVMRRAMEGILPKKVQWRPGKSDLSHGFNSGLLNFENDRLHKTLEIAPTILEKYVNVESLKNVYARFSDGTASVSDVLKLSNSVSLALWLQNSKFTN